MRIYPYSQGIQFSSDGGRTWESLSDSAFEAALKSWDTDADAVRKRMASGEPVHSPYVKQFCYRVGGAAQGLLAL